MKSFLKLLGRSLFILLALIFGSLFYFWIDNQLYLGGSDPEQISYLQKHKTDLSSLEPEAELFDDHFYQNQIFLLGESHGSADVQWLDELLLKHLNQQVGLRFYLAEMDSVTASMLNRFLKGSKPDSSLLKAVVSQVGRRIPQQASQGFYNKWLSIYHYNQHLPDSLRIEVIGIDKDLNEGSRGLNRDSAMLLNFRRVLKEKGMEKEKFYGLFGYNHILQAPINEAGFTPFAAKLKQSDLPMAGRIQSIACYNLDGEMRLPANDQFPGPADEKTAMLNVDGPFMLVKGIYNLAAVSDTNTISLFKLDEDGSPYRRSQMLAGVKVRLMGSDILPSDEQRPTTDYFQYVILSRNSKALKGLRP